MRVSGEPSSVKDTASSLPVKMNTAISYIPLLILALANKRRSVLRCPVDEGRMRTLAIVAGVLLARHHEEPRGPARQAIATSRTPLSLASGWECPGRRLSRG